MQKVASNDVDLQSNVRRIPRCFTSRKGVTAKRDCETSVGCIHVQLREHAATSVHAVIRRLRSAFTLVNFVYGGRIVYEISNRGRSVR